jgi:general secretion pathway protein E
MSGEQVGVRSGDRAIETGRPESTCRLPLGTVLFAVTLLFGITGSASPVSAQAPAAAQPGVQPGGTAALPVAVARQTGQFPNSPFPFARGDDQGGSNVGFYFSLGKLIPVLLLFFGWIWMCNWVNEDSKGLKLDAPVWNTGVLVGGLAGFGAVLTFPAFFLGFLALLVVGGGPSAWYLYTRNQHVPESARLLTPRHIQTLLIRLMSRLGINLAPSKEARDKALGPPIRFIGKSASGKGEDETRARQAEKSRGFMAARELVYDAILRRSTDVHLEPKQDELSVRYRIDGSMQLGEPFDRAIGDAIINIFKVLSAMDITEKRKPQDGSFRAELEGRMIDFRVASAGTRDGEKISMRILDQSNSVSKLAQLGMRKQMQEKLVEIVHMPHGMLLCCGPTGAGKSTSLYAMINELDSYQSNIITVEDPVEYKMKNVTQIEINTKAGQTFAGTLRSILRQDPDVVMIGEIRDEETARICCQAANTGHMVFSTVHANDSLSALYRLMDLGIEPFLLSSSLSGILSQRLVRKLCDDCKEAYKPKAELLEQIGLTPDRVQTMYRPPTQPEQTCPTCSGSGYRGRVGVYELFEITERIRDMVRDGASMTDIRGEARKNGMIYLKEEALRLVVKGITSMQEVNATIK